MSSGNRLLLTQRNTALYLERARVRVEGSRVVYDKAEGLEEKTFSIPYANLAILFLGQGTSLTQSAARMLSEEGVYIAFTGTGGSPLHYGSLTNYQITQYMKSMYEISSSEERSLETAKRAMQQRAELIRVISPKVWDRLAVQVDREEFMEFIEEFCESIEQVNTGSVLLGNEGMFTRELYALYAEGAGLGSFKRLHGEGKKDSREAVINSRLDHGNYIAYGIAGAALWALGIPSCLSFLHGKTRAGGLVFDLADIFKDALVLPIAFADHASEAEFRARLMDAAHDHKILEKCFSFLKSELERIG